MRQKLLGIVEEHERLSELMCTQEVASSPDIYRSHAKKQAEIADLVHCFRAFQEEERQLRDVRELWESEKDPDLQALIEEERDHLVALLEQREKDLHLLLLPKDPNDAKNTIVEIRAGTGGEEAALFVADLFRMYSRFAELKNWKVEILGSNPTGIGGYKEITFMVSGQNVYSQLKFEGGGHRVQRVPATEAQGRIHTSAVTVAVLPEAEEVDVSIDPSDLHIDVYRSSGAGGQHVNTTDSAVRITHKPTGIVVTCQDERSQHKNRAKALAVLRARLLAAKQEEEETARSADRKSQVGSGDRSERIRTYNFPQNRMTDHRINLTLYRLDSIMEGNIQEMIEALVAADREARLIAV
ncbi:MAG TPA: peptide chain release factor 1 [Candidatus Hydrogenedentes bacterium]|nr:peptide chain release factor 1 [Candidatus Hydrogenedentota bacterium]HOS01857.1 peptide chain release factor 1 [Candidatus Hydrogenedentota bacterium]